MLDFLALCVDQVVELTFVTGRVDDGQTTQGVQADYVTDSLGIFLRHSLAGVGNQAIKCVDFVGCLPVHHRRKSGK